LHFLSVHYATSSNAYTNNELALEWLEKVFHPETVDKAARRWRLLVLDGHGSDETADFLTFHFTHRLYLLCLPPRMWHNRQPLDVGCFSPLRRYYPEGVRAATKEGAPKVSKRMFIYPYRAARDGAFTTSTILGSWKGAGLYPFDSHGVISRANPRLNTPPPSASIDEMLLPE
jgi:hypothetical protein